MINNPLNLLVSSFILLSIDSVYLYFIKDYFSKQIQIIQGSPVTINYLATAMSYLVVLFGLYYFIIQPKRSLLDAFLLGFVIYGVYETTSKALFSKWSWLTVLIDSLWGGILFLLTTYIFRVYIV
jgi:uncharacterized membrane protein